jgi:hypothetical protein
MIKQLSKLKYGRDKQIVEAEIAKRARLWEGGKILRYYDITILRYYDITILGGRKGQRFFCLSLY